MKLPLLLTPKEVILIGVGDKGELIGLETYLEEEFWLKQAAEQECVPPVSITFELFQIGQQGYSYC